MTSVEMINLDDAPRVWIGCLACYNAGNLKGAWVDASEAAAYVPCEGDQHESHEEFLVMDHENFQGFLSGECSPAEAQEISERMEELEREREYNLAAVGAWLSNYHLKLGDFDRTSFEDSYSGTYDTFIDFAQELADEMGLGEDDWSFRWPTNCIDWEAASRELGYDYWTAPDPTGGVFVFRDM